MRVMRTPGVRVEAFGSSASGLCLPDSDLDLGLLGHWVDPEVPLHLLHRQAQLDLLNLLSRDIPRMGLAYGRVSVRCCGCHSYLHNPESSHQQLRAYSLICWVCKLVGLTGQIGG